MRQETHADTMHAFLLDYRTLFMHPTMGEEMNEATHLKIESSIAAICSTIKYPRLSSIMEGMLSLPGS